MSESYQSWCVMVQRYFEAVPGIARDNAGKPLLFNDRNDAVLRIQELERMSNYDRKTLYRIDPITVTIAT